MSAELIGTLIGLLAVGLLIFFVCRPSAQARRHAAERKRDDELNEAVRRRITAQAAARAIKKAQPAGLVLTVDQLAKVNRERRLTGRHQLSREGFKAAVEARRADSRAPAAGSPTNDWLLWFLVFNTDDSRHHGQIDHARGDITIQPGGGAYGGAGASGSWTAADVPTDLDAPSRAAAMAGGVVLGATLGHPGYDTPEQRDAAMERGNESRTDYGTGSPTSRDDSPAYEAPSSRESSTPSSSESSSYSSSSDSGGGSSSYSSSSDSGSSSSSGGGDGGGGGGGGGGD